MIAKARGPILTPTQPHPFFYSVPPPPPPDTPDPLPPGMDGDYTPPPPGPRGPPRRFPEDQLGPDQDGPSWGWTLSGLLVATTAAVLVVLAAWWGVNALFGSPIK